MKGIAIVEAGQKLTLNVSLPFEGSLQMDVRPGVFEVCARALKTRDHIAQPPAYYDREVGMKDERIKVYPAHARPRAHLPVLV